jgi:hypothetical protein
MRLIGSWGRGSLIVRGGRRGGGRGGEMGGVIDYLRDFQHVSFRGSLNGCFRLAFAWVGVLEEEKEKATLLNHTLYNSHRNKEWQGTTSRYEAKWHRIA